MRKWNEDKTRYRSCFQFWDLSLFTVKITTILFLSFMLKQKIFAKNWGENGTYFFFQENALCFASSSAGSAFCPCPNYLRAFHHHFTCSQNARSDFCNQEFYSHLYTCVCSCTYTVDQGQKMNTASNIKNKKHDSRTF